MAKKLTASQGRAAIQSEVDQLHAAAKRGTANPVDAAAARMMRPDGTIRLSPSAYWTALSAAEAFAAGKTEAVFLYESEHNQRNADECKRTGNWPW